MPGSSSPSASRIGSTELGSFRIIGLLGQGSFAEAYLAEQLGMFRNAVVKIAHARAMERSDREAVAARFLDEVRAATRVQHPNLATIYTAGMTSDGLPAIAMELVPGDSFEAYLTRSAPLPLRELDYFAQLASVLGTVHRLGIVHRDVSPGNVMVTRDHDGGPSVKLLDFGIAKIDGSTDASSSPMGTPRYAAPEQIRGRAVPASDLYGLGAILWWALTGRAYLDQYDSTAAVVEWQMAMRAAPDPRALQAEIAPGFAELTRQLLAPRPEQRPSAADVLERWPRLIAEARRHRQRRGHRASSPVAAQSSRALRLLVIDPDPVKRLLVMGFAERLGCTVTATDDPRSATRGLLGAHDVAVLATELPRVDAAAVGRHLRTHFPEQRLVLMSSRGERLVTCEDAEADLSLDVPGELLRLADYLRALQTRSRRGAGTPLETIDPHEVVSTTILESWRRRPPDELRAEIETFLGAMPELIAVLDGLRGATVGEADVLSACSSIEHRASSLGAFHLCRLAKSLRLLVAAGELSDPDGFITELEEEYQRVFRRLLEALTDLSSPSSNVRG